MSPEMIIGKDYGTKCDIWGLGISLIEMIDGSPPLSDVHPVCGLYSIL